MTQDERKLPKTRIATLFVGLNNLSVITIVVAYGFGLFMDNKDGASVIRHLSIGLTGSLLGMFSLVGTMFYLVTTGAAIKQAVLSYKLDSELYRRTARLKAKTFPWCMGLIILLIGTTVVGGLVHVGKIPPVVHLAIATLTAMIYLFGIRRIKQDFHTDRIIMADTLDAVDAAEAEQTPETAEVNSNS